MCQYTLNNSIKEENKQTLEHHLIHALAKALPPQFSKSIEDNYIVHPSVSTDQSSPCPSRIRVPGNRCKFVGLYPATEILKVALGPSGVPDGLVWIVLPPSLLQDTKGELQCNISS